MLLSKIIYAKVKHIELSYEGQGQNGDYTIHKVVCTVGKFDYDFKVWNMKEFPKIGSYINADVVIKAKEYNGNNYTEINLNNIELFNEKGEALKSNNDQNNNVKQTSTGNNFNAPF